jgi:2-(1,2-epoxy-1,2-dihydrophenyl)acetyl-CoA isomerase
VNEEKQLLIERQDNGVVYLTINRPKKKNALSYEVVIEMLDAVRDIDRDLEVRCVILRGAGGCFCAGGDLGPAMSGKQQTVLEGRRSMIEYGNLIAAIVRCDKPFIAQVDGYALGGGLSLALACDMLFVAESAKLSSMFTHVGVSPEMGSLLFLPQAIGMYRAKELWYTGRRVSAQEAYELGFVSRVCKDDTLEAETMEMAGHIATLPRVTMTMMKRSLNSHVYHELEAILSLDPANTLQCLSDGEAMAYLMENFRK